MFKKMRAAVVDCGPSVYHPLQSQIGAPAASYYPSRRGQSAIMANAGAEVRSITSACSVNRHRGMRIWPYATVAGVVSGNRRNCQLHRFHQNNPAEGI